MAGMGKSDYDSLQGLGRATSDGTKRHKMAQKTTDKRGCCVARGSGFSLAWRGWLAVLVAFLAACSTAQQRESPTSIVGVLRFRDARAAALFRDSHRAGNLYQDFRPVMTVDALPLDLRYRELYLDMLKERYLMPEAQLAPLRAEQDQEFDNNFELVVLIYGGSNEPVPLERPNSVWRILLRDDDGHLLPPSKIEKIRADSPVYQYLNLYFYGLDRWTQLYRIRFPKLAKTVVGQAPGQEPVQLIVTGVAGTVILSWADPGLFYRPAARAGGEGAMSPVVITPRPDEGGSSFMAMD
jgi:hypothetical protein